MGGIENRSLSGVGSPASHLMNRVEQVRAYVARTLGLAALAWAGGGLALTLALAWLLAGQDGWGVGSPLPLLLVGLLVAMLVGLAVAWQRLVEGWGSSEGVARVMDVAASLPDGTILGSLELAENLPVGASAVLRDAALAQVVPNLAGPQAELAGTTGERTRLLLRRGGRTASVLVPVVILLAWISPDRSMGAWSGLVSPLSPFSESARPALIIQPGDMDVPRGEAVEIVVSAGPRESVTLHWETTGQVVQDLALPVLDGRATTSLPPISAPTRYWAQSADGSRSRIYTLTPVDPLFVGSVTVTVNYPPHTGISPEEFRNDVPALILPTGTRIMISGQGSRPLGTASLVGLNGDPVLDLNPREASFSAEWTPRGTGVYTWMFTDIGGNLAAAAPEPLDVTMLGDAAPSVALIYPESDTLLPINRRQPLVVEAGDDYGLARIEIVVRRITSFGVAHEPVTQRMDLGGLQAAVARPFLDLAAWDLMPGDTIRYFARAVDNSPGGQSAQTREYILRVPQLVDLGRAAQEELDEAAERMDALAEEARNAAAETQDLQDESAMRNENGQQPGEQGAFEEREEVRQAMERQSALLQAVDSLQKELAELRKALQEGGLADPELNEELRSLEETLEQMDASEIREDMEASQEELGDMDPAALQELLDKLAEDQQAFKESLEASVEQFRQAAIDQDFRATNEEAEDLAREQQILADAMEEGGQEQLRAEQQAALEERAEELQDRLETLQERLDKAGEDKAGARMQEARHQLSEARQKMQQAQQGGQQSQQSQGEQAEAQDAAQQAADDMQEISDELQEAQKDLQQQMAEGVQEALHQTAKDALSLARRQSELRDQMQGASRESLAEMRGDESALAQGLRNLAENYADGTQMAAPGARELLAAVGEAMKSLEGALESMEGRRGRRASPMGDAQKVVESLNAVAMMAMASGQGEGQSSGSSSEQQMQQMEQLAQQQGDLMSEASQLSPMQLGQETMQQQMEELAGQQDQIAEELSEMSQEQGAEGEGEGEGEALGELEELALEAKRLAEAMAQGRLDPEVLRRQEELFHRLLDAGRSLERGEDTEEREADAPGEFERNTIEALTVESMNALRYSLPGATALQGLSPGQRTLVLKYFRRLNDVADEPPPARRQP